MIKVLNDLKFQSLYGKKLSKCIKFCVWLYTTILREKDIDLVRGCFNIITITIIIATTTAIIIIIVTIICSRPEFTCMKYASLKGCVYFGQKDTI